MNDDSSSLLFRPQQQALAVHGTWFTSLDVPEGYNRSTPSRFTKEIGRLATLFMRVDANTTRWIIRRVRWPNAKLVAKHHWILVEPTPWTPVRYDARRP